MLTQKFNFLCAAFVGAALAFSSSIVSAQDVPAATEDKDVAVNGPKLDTSLDYFAVISTDKGDIVVDLLEDTAPITVRNFVNLAEGTKPFKDPKTGAVKKAPYYENVPFHRILKGFMIQSGDPTGTGTGGPGYTIKDEFTGPTKFTEEEYLMAMANTGRPNSGGAQFFITDAGQSQSYGFLNGKYTIFGRVHSGKATVDSIASVEVKPSPGNPREISSPVVAPQIKSVKVHRVAEGETIEQKIAPAQ